MAQPKSKLVKFKYFDTVTLDPSAVPNTPAKYVFRGNDLYDPDYTGTGHQPMGFDQWMGWYDHFVVISSKITVTFMTDGVQSASTKGSARVGIKIDDDASTSAYTQTIMESNNNRWTFLNTNSNQFARLTMKASTRKFLGRSKVLSDPELKGSTSASPTEGFYYTLFADWPTGDTTNDPGAIQAAVYIEYLAVLIEPKDVTSS